MESFDLGGHSLTDDVGLKFDDQIVSVQNPNHPATLLEFTIKSGDVIPVGAPVFQYYNSASGRMEIKAPDNATNVTNDSFVGICTKVKTKADGTLVAVVAVNGFVEARRLVENNFVSTGAEVYLASVASEYTSTAGLSLVNEGTIAVGKVTDYSKQQDGVILCKLYSTPVVYGTLQKNGTKPLPAILRLRFQFLKTSGSHSHYYSTIRLYSELSDFNPADANAGSLLTNDNMTVTKEAAGYGSADACKKSFQSHTGNTWATAGDRYFQCHYNAGDTFTWRGVSKGKATQYTVTLNMPAPKPIKYIGFGGLNDYGSTGQFQNTTMYLEVSYTNSGEDYVPMYMCRYQGGSTNNHTEVPDTDGTGWYGTATPGAYSNPTIDANGRGFFELKETLT